MANTVYNIKRGDTARSIQGTIKDPANNPVALGSATVKFLMRGPRGDSSALKVNQSATVVDAPTGVVRYDWQPADVNTVGVFDAEWEVTHSGGKIETYPNDSYIEIRIRQDLNPA